MSQRNVKTLYIEPGSPWENGYIESLNGRLRNELLDGEIFDTLKEAQELIERRRRHYKWYYANCMLMYRRHIASGAPIERIRRHLQPCGEDQAGVEEYG